MRKLIYLLGIFAMCSIPAAALGDNKDEGTRGRFDPSRLEAETEVDRILSNWPQMHREVAHEIIKKYGKADGAADSHLTWIDNGPWAATIVFKEEFKHNWPKPHVDFVQQFVKMKVPPDKFDEVAAFDGSVQIDRTAGLVSARCGGEPMNYLALNLTHDIATGKRTVEDARAFYSKTAASDEPSPYTERLLFVQQSDSADPDKPQK